MSDRFEKLETKLALAEDLLEVLNNTVYRQQCRIDQMQRDLDELRAQMRSMPSESRGPAEEVPPHY